MLIPNKNRINETLKNPFSHLFFAFLATFYPTFLVFFDF